MIEGISLAEGRSRGAGCREVSPLGARGRNLAVETSLPSGPQTTARWPMRGAGARPGGPPRGVRITIAGRVTHWEPIARESTIGGRVLRVAASVFLVSDVPVGVGNMASRHQPSDPGARWVVTHRRVERTLTRYALQPIAEVRWVQVA